MTDKYESLDELFEDEEFEVSEESQDNVPPEVKSRLALALDVDDLIDARRLAGSLFDFFGTVKVGLELYTASGPDSVGVFTEAGFDVFCDLKLHDIPTTVHKAARVVGSVGARWVTAHVAGGEEMLKVAVEGLSENTENITQLLEQIARLETGCPSSSPVAIGWAGHCSARSARPSGRRTHPPRGAVNAT